VSFKENPSSFSMEEWQTPEGINVVIAFYDGIDCLNINFRYRYADAANQLRRVSELARQRTPVGFNYALSILKTNILQ